MFLADLPLAPLLPRRARHRNRFLPAAKPPTPAKAEVRPGVLGHFCGWLPLQILCKGLIALSCVSSFAVMVAFTKSTDGARRRWADCWALNSPTVRHAHLLLPNVDMEMPNCLHGTGALSNMGLRSGVKEDSTCSGLMEMVRFARHGGPNQFRARCLPQLTQCTGAHHAPGVPRSGRSAGRVRKRPLRWRSRATFGGGRPPQAYGKRTGKRGGLCVRYDACAECRSHIPCFIGII